MMWTYLIEKVQIRGVSATNLQINDLKNRFAPFDVIYRAKQITLIYILH